MSKSDILTDDYVAGLLASEAQDCSIKYSAMGMNAYQPDKKPVHKPKPNTRFLRHIIKDTDTHNKNLLAKEAAESKARLESLEQVEESKRLKTNPNAGDIRRRQMGDIHAILGNKQRSRKERRSSSDKHRSSQESQQRNNSIKDRELFTDYHRHTHEDRLKEVKYGKSSERESEKSSKSARRRNRSPESKSNSREHRKRVNKSSRRTSSDNHRERSRSRSPSHRRRPHRQRSPPLRSPSDESADELMGPQPAPKLRGRGALAGASGIDRRFSESYDPTEDRHMEDANGYWSEAVEDFRNRQKLRLQDIGGGDTFHGQGSKNAKCPEDTVQWSKPGEEREWDRIKHEASIDIS